MPSQDKTGFCRRHHEPTPFGQHRACFGRGCVRFTGLTLGLAGSAHATPARPNVSSVQTVVFDCPGQHAMIRPKTFILACADGNALLDKLLLV
jgi:hypothetical protein